jgi:hypothetical protein
MTSTHDHVREHSPDAATRDIDRETAERVRACAAAGREALDRRIEELGREWDVERVLEVNGSILAGAGLALGATVDRRWLLLSGAVVTFCLQHAVQGWCPPVEAFRRLGVRTRKEIERERYALKALRGDFAAAGGDADAALAAARA